MIKALRLFTLLLAVNIRSVAQCPDRQIGNFDLDTLPDTIYCTFSRDTVDGPVTQLHMVRGCGKKLRFNMKIGFEQLLIHNPSTGSLETYYSMGGNNGFEEQSLYRYDPKYDDWILIETTTTSRYYPTTVERADIPTGISGREYPKPLRKKKLKR